METISIAALRGAEIIDVPDPLLGPEDVLADIHYVGFCGSHLNTPRGLSQLLTLPRIPDHEVSGVIAGRGKRVPVSIPVGDMVLLSPNSRCGLCPTCRVGRTNCSQLGQTLGMRYDGALTRSPAIHYSRTYARAAPSRPKKWPPSSR